MEIITSSEGLIHIRVRWWMQIDATYKTTNWYEAYLSIWNFIIENREEIYPREPPIPTRRNKILAIISLPVQRSNK